MPNIRTYRLQIQIENFRAFYSSICSFFFSVTNSEEKFNFIRDHHNTYSDSTEISQRHKHLLDYCRYMSREIICYDKKYIMFCLS